MKQEETDLIKYGNCFVEHKNGELKVICPEDVVFSNGMYEVKTVPDRCKYEIVQYGEELKLRSILLNARILDRDFRIRNKCASNFMVVSDSMVSLFEEKDTAKQFEGIPSGCTFDRHREFGRLVFDGEDPLRIGMLDRKWAVYSAKWLDDNTIIMGYRCPLNHYSKERRRMEKRRGFLARMFRNLDDIKDGTDEEVKQDLMDMGIDIDKAKASFDELMDKIKRTKNNV